MIRIVVEPDYLNQLPVRHPGVCRDGFQRVWYDLNGRSFRELPVEELDKVYVGDILKECHEEATRLLKEHCLELLEHRRQALAGVGRLYGYPYLDATVENAADSLSPCVVAPHGSLNGRPVTLADECAPSVVLGFLRVDNFSKEGRSIKMLRQNCISMINGLRPRPQAQTGELLRLTGLRCHHCDSLGLVYGRALAFRDQLEAALRRENSVIADVVRGVFDGADDKVLVLGVLPEGFLGYGALRQLDPQLSLLASHALLKPAAVRRGIGVPEIRRLVPVSLWERLPTPVRAFVLDAAEASADPKPLPPRLPTESELEELSEPRQPMGLMEYVGRYDPFGYDRDHPEILGFVGLRRAADEYDEYALQEGAVPRQGWIEAVMELKSALYDDDIEQSLHLQETLDLYALHKRILGLVEYVVIPELKSRRILDGKGGTSAMWCAAFTGKNSPACLAIPLLALDQDDHASVEVEGHWLIEAYRCEQDGDAGPLDLADLLNSLVASLNAAPKVSGVSVTLTPSDPSEHARQLAALSQAGNSASATMTLYLGKVALALRNYIEHGHDEVCGDRLRIDGKHYWETLRGKKSTYQWVRDQAATVTPVWRHHATLAGMLPTPPAPANAVFLSAKSLRRCLTLLTCVLHAGIGHLHFDRRDDFLNYIREPARAASHDTASSPGC